MDPATETVVAATVCVAVKFRSRTSVIVATGPPTAAAAAACTGATDELGLEVGSKPKVDVAPVGSSVTKSRSYSVTR